MNRVQLTDLPYISSARDDDVGFVPVGGERAPDGHYNDARHRTEEACSGDDPSE